jgi:hypothetical protein
MSYSRRGAAPAAAALTIIASMIGLMVCCVTTSAAAQGVPAAPSITSPPDNASEASPTVEVGGMASAGASVGVFDDGVAVAGTTADAGGNWSTTVDLLAGPHDLTAVQALPAQEGDTTPQSPPSTAVQVDVTGNQVVVNGSFEQPGVASSGGSWENFPQGSGQVAGWDSTNSCGIELQTEGTVGVAPYDGNQYAELESNCPSGLTQTLATVPGTEYVVSFAYQARPGTAASMNTISAEWGGDYLAGSADAGSGLQGGSKWALAQYAVTATSPTTVVEFDSTDPGIHDSTGGFLDDVSVVPAAALEANTSWLTAQSLAPPGGAGTAGTQEAIDYSGEALWYDVPIEPGEQVQVSLSNLPADYGIAVFSDISQTFEAETSSTPNLAALGAQAPGNAASFSAFSPSAFSPSAFSPSAFSPSAFSPSAFSPSAFSPSAFSPSAFSPSAFSPSAFSSAYSAAQLDSLLAVSTAPGAVDKSVTADTWNSTGNFYIRISGNNGADAPFEAFSLSVTTSGGPCQGAGLQAFTSDGFATASGGTVNDASGTPYATVIVDDSQLMPAVAPGGSLYGALQDLAGATDGAVVDVGQSDWVRDLTAQAQAKPGCPYAENLEAEAIQDIVNTYRVTSTNLRYVVIVGDDDIIPFFRQPDNAGLAPESDYEPPLSSTTAADAALQDDLFLSDDEYGAATELTLQGTTVPLPTAAVGRLVETPNDIFDTVEDYLAGNEVIKPTASLVTGYDFMQPPASEIAQAFSTGLPGGANSTLITNDGVPASSTGTPPGYSWTAAELGTALFGSHHGLVFLGGHFSANNLLAADDTTTLTTNQFASDVGTSLEGSLVLSAGCHAGYNIDGADGIQGVTDDLAWPQAFAEAGATLVAGTGYQYGDTNYVAYSDQVYVDLAQQLGYEPIGGGAVDIGTALIAAKQQYLASLDQLNGVEEKALGEITLYGLPMLGVQEPVQVSAPASPASSVTANPVVTTSPLSAGDQLGLEEATLAVSPTLDPQAVTPPGSTTTYTYDSGPQGVVADPGGPVLPVQVDDVNVAGLTLRGVGLWSGGYGDQPAPDPLTGDPATETGNSEVSPFASPVFFPQTTWNPNYFSTLLDGGDTDLALTPVQYQTAASGTDMRTYSSLGLHLFYSGNVQTYGGNTPALAAPPTISDVTSTVDGDTVTVSAAVAGDPSAGIQEVWVTYTGNAPGDPLYGAWQSVDLTQSAGNSALWTGTFTDASGSNQGSPATDASFLVQAVNGVGEVSMDNNDGYYFTPALTPGAPPPPGATLDTFTLELSAGASGQYLTGAPVEATLLPTAANPGATVTNEPVTFGLGATTVAATLVNGTATATVPLVEPPGSYELTASYGGDAGDQPAAASADFTINPAATNLSLSAPGQVTSGVDSGVTATLLSGGLPLAQRAVYFEVSDPGGTVVGTGVGITNSLGVAQAGALALPPGDVGAGYSITAYFGANDLVLPGGGTYDAADPDYLPSTSGAAGLTVIDPTRTTLTAAPNPAAFGQPLTLTASVSPPSSDGTVSFYLGASGIGACAQTQVTSGLATCTVTGLAPGPYSFSATYSGYSPSYLGSTSGTVVSAVGEGSTVTTLLAPSTAPFGSVVSVTAQVQPVAPASGNPGGTVTFYDGSGIIGTGALIAGKGGVEAASIAVRGLQGGGQALSAVYSGNGDFLASTGSASVTVTFTKTISGVDNASLTVLPGQTVLVTGKVTGSVLVGPGGGLEVEGGSIGGSLSSLGALGVSLCGARVAGAVSVGLSLGYVFIGGGTTGCAPSALSGAVALAGNLGGVEITTTSMSGPLSVVANLGYGPVQANGVFPPTEIAGNTISGTLACNLNVPAPSDAGQPNKAASRSGQCANPANF